jgi:hypothetical protein
MKYREIRKSWAADVGGTDKFGVIRRLVLQQRRKVRGEKSEWGLEV